jgi:hypothetical protein
VPLLAPAAVADAVTMGIRLLPHFVVRVCGTLRALSLSLSLSLSLLTSFLTFRLLSLPLPLRLSHTVVAVE